MRILVTTSRMPTAVEEIRKLGRNGHEIHAADTFAAAPGGHSRWAHRRHVIASPRYDTAGFLGDVVDIVDEHAIDLVLPIFEEVFYLQRHADGLSGRTRVFAPEFAALRRLHDKALFVELARELGVDVPRTIVVDDAAGLRLAIASMPRYFARPAYSRGGLFLLTNTGPLAGVVRADACRPTPTNPWLVQEFVTGQDVCTFSVARNGRIVAHVTYVHPKTIASAGGIVFESIIDPETLVLAQRFVEATKYDGQVSFDFIRTERGLVAVECNPRPTAGAGVMPDAMLVQAILADAPGAPLVAPAGVRRHLGAALLRDMVLHMREIPSDIRELLSGSEDLYGARGDRWPALWQFLSLSHVWRYRRRRAAADRTRSDLLAGYFDDVSWDGEIMPPAPLVLRTNPRLASHASIRARDSA